MKPFVDRLFIQLGYGKPFFPKQAQTVHAQRREPLPILREIYHISLDENKN